jgi:hypothetical protein
VVGRVVTGTQITSGAPGIAMVVGVVALTQVGMYGVCFSIQSLSFCIRVDAFSGEYVTFADVNVPFACRLTTANVTRSRIKALSSITSAGTCVTGKVGVASGVQQHRQEDRCGWKK